FPEFGELNDILIRTTGNAEPQPDVITGGDQIIAMQAVVRDVPLPSNVADYVSRLVVATHPSYSSNRLVQDYVRYGASPRGGQAMILGAKANALMDGRYNVSFDDIAAIAHAALRHRLLLNFEGLAEGISPDQIVADLLQSVVRDING
ncbi:MAG: AAA family ATPase, partial [Chloroflexota bacterium]